MADESDTAEDGDESELPVVQRKLVTQSYDLSVNTLLEQWLDHTLRLPEIQRQYVWDNAKASRLVESLLLNIPIPVLYFAETQQSEYLVIDGHQRVKSIDREWREWPDSRVSRDTRGSDGCSRDARFVT